MFVVIVHLRVRPGHLAAFLDGIEANARATRREPGRLRFDVLRGHEDSHRFTLYEIYRGEAAFTVEHRSAPHYPAWRTVAAECVESGTHLNSFWTPAFPEDLPEAAADTGDHSGERSS
ncbi:putative quinol monooxygenase [Nonomuraea sp. NPDC049269]|uniref:putative quinol monooxygenase n=1 Tax=Nonomuraea sp. NPDC049269 TaxID=3364349 RepID=UPI003718C519